MADLLQGDIFTVATERQCELTVVFGHIGMNGMDADWRQFVATQPRLNHILNPFGDVPNQPVEFGDHQRLWFVPACENHGLTETQFVSALDAALTWASANGVSSVTTNGIANTDHSHDTASNRASDDARAKLLIDLASTYEKDLEVTITLVSRNDVFLRNAT
jgi:hypothetical protein